MTDHTILAWFQALVDRCEWVPSLFRAWLVCSGIVSGLTAVYPDFTTRPAYARFIIGFLDPFVANLGRWRLAIRDFRKNVARLVAPQESER